MRRIEGNDVDRRDQSGQHFNNRDGFVHNNNCHETNEHNTNAYGRVHMHLDDLPVASKLGKS